MDIDMVSLKKEKKTEKEVVFKSSNGIDVLPPLNNLASSFYQGSVWHQMKLASTKFSTLIQWEVSSIHEYSSQQ
jgi:hypothetical protein